MRPVNDRLLACVGTAGPRMLAVRLEEEVAELLRASREEASYAAGQGFTDVDHVLPRLDALERALLLIAARIDKQTPPT